MPQALEKSELLVKLGAEVERVKPVAIANPRHYVNLAREYAARCVRVRVRVCVCVHVCACFRVCVCVCVLIAS